MLCGRSSDPFPLSDAGDALCEPFSRIGVGLSAGGVGASTTSSLALDASSPALDASSVSESGDVCCGCVSAVDVVYSGVGLVADGAGASDMSMALPGSFCSPLPLSSSGFMATSRPV